MLSFGYNICFCVDLYITLKHPLISGRKRNIYYHIFSWLFGIIFTVTSMLISEPHESFPINDNFKFNHVFKSILTIIVIVIGLVSVCMGWCKIRNMKVVEGDLRATY